MKKIDCRTEDLKHQTGVIAKAILKNCHFQSRTLLKLFNLTVEEVQGKHSGILYSVLDEKGNKVG